MICTKVMCREELHLNQILSMQVKIDAEDFELLPTDFYTDDKEATEDFGFW